MSRARRQAYRATELAELARQLKYMPAAKRAEAVRNSEQLHDELDPATNYPIDFVVYRLTGRRVPPSENVMLVGEAIRPDLRLIIDALSRSIELTEDPGDPCETTAELAARLGVSTKTIARWRGRGRGLRWRWGVREAGGKPGVLFPRSAVRAFEAADRGRVEQARRFDRMTQHERQRLVARARRLAEASDQPPQAILRHLAKRTGRSVEALRQRIAQHDADHPDEQVFADRTGPLTQRQKRLIDRAYRRGVTVSRLGRRLGKTRSTIYRAIHEARARRVLSVKLVAFASPMFDRDDADEVILRPIKRSGRPRRLDRAVIDALPASLGPLYNRPIDSDRVIKSLLVQYNYLKHRARLLQDELRDPPLRASDMDRFDDLLRRADVVRGQVVAGALPIVLSVVRRQLSSQDAADEARLLRALDAGHAVLIEQIDRFDPAHAHAFESVLTNRLLRELAGPLRYTPAMDEDRLFARLATAGFRLEDSGEF